MTVQRFKLTVGNEVGQWLKNTYILASDYDKLLSENKKLRRLLVEATSSKLNRAEVKELE